MLAIGAVDADAVRRTSPVPPVVHQFTNVEYAPVTLDMNCTGIVNDPPGAMVSPTFGRFAELKLAPRLPFVMFVQMIGAFVVSIEEVHAEPVNVRVSAPTLERMTEAERPEVAA